MCAAALATMALAVPQTVFGAGFQETTQSGTAVGMVNAGVANPDEPNSSYYNPAAMSYRDGLQTYVGASLIYPTIEYSPFPGENGDTTTDNVKTVHPLPNFHLGYAITDDLSAGVGLTAPYGLAVDWPSNWRGREVNEFVEIATVNLNPNLSYKIGDTGLSVAGGASIVYSWVELERDVGLGEDQFVQSQLGGDGWGFGGVAALMYRPTENLTLGAQYRSRFNVEYTDAKVHFEGEENTPFYSTFRDNPGSAEITFPDAINAGIGYQWNDFFLQFEAGYTVWDTFDVINVEIDTGGDEQALSNFELEQNWENAWAFRLGGQYDVTPQIPVRLGVAYDRTPVPDETVNATLPDNHRIAGSVGAGYKFSQDWRIDGAYELVDVMEREIRNDVGPRGAYNSAGHILSINVGYGYE
jgi:long-chain fatty acid transport protein